MEQLQLLAAQFTKLTNVFITVHFWFAMFVQLLILFLGYRWGVGRAISGHKKE